MEPKKEQSARMELRVRLAEERRKAFKEGYIRGYQRAMEDKKMCIVRQDVRDIPLEGMGLTKKAHHRLQVARKKTLGEVADTELDSIFYMNGIGPKIAADIARCLRQHGIYGTAWEYYLPEE